MGAPWSLESWRPRGGDNGALQADLNSYVDEVATRRLAALEQQQEDREREEEYYANLNLCDEDRY